jgi:hypothetical protein
MNSTPKRALKGPKAEAAVARLIPTMVSEIHQGLLDQGGPEGAPLGVPLLGETAETQGSTSKGLGEKLPIKTRDAPCYFSW